MRRLLIGIGVLVVVAAGAFVVFGPGGGNGEDDAPTTTLPPVDTGALVEADAIVVPVRSAGLSLPGAGRVAEILVAVGERVEAGQVLIRLDAEQEAAALAEAEAALASALARLAQLRAAQAKDEAGEDEARPVQLAAARTAVLDARQVLEDAQDLSGITEETQDRASSSQRDLDSAGRDLIIAQLDGKADTEAAQESHDKAKDDYRDVYAKWLGITPSEEDLGHDPDSLFQAWGLDLEVAFDRASLTSTGLPVANDPSTVWNEIVVFTWSGDSNLDRTCGAGELLPGRVCIEREFDDAWDDFEQAGDSLESTRAGAATAVAGAENAIIEAERALEDAQKALDDLQTERPALDIALAEKKLAAAELEVAKLEQGRDPLDVALSEAELASAEADVTAAEARLAVMRVPLRERELRAPFAGTIGSVDVSAGELVSPSMVVVKIADLSAWRVETQDLDEINVVNLREKDPVVVTFDALPDVEIAGTVVSIGQFGEEKQGAITYTAVIELEETDKRLRWNMTAAIRKRGE